MLQFGLQKKIYQFWSTFDQVPADRLQADGDHEGFHPTCSTSYTINNIFLHPLLLLISR